MSDARTEPTGPPDLGHVEPDGHCDEQGPIPAFGPVRTDERGRIVLTDEERAARRAAAIRMLRVLGTHPDTDPPARTRRSCAGSMRTARTAPCSRGCIELWPGSNSWKSDHFSWTWG
jgi:hypothetical protein